MHVYNAYTSLDIPQRFLVNDLASSMGRQGTGTHADQIARLSLSHVHAWVIIVEDLDELHQTWTTWQGKDICTAIHWTAKEVACIMHVTISSYTIN